MWEEVTRKDVPWRALVLLNDLGELSASSCARQACQKRPTFLNATRVASSLVTLSFNVKVAICWPRARTAGWTSLSAFGSVSFFAMGRWLKHSGTTGPVGCLGAGAGVGPGFLGRLASDVVDASCLDLFCFPPLCLSFVTGAAGLGSAALDCSLRAAFSAFFCAFSWAPDSFGAAGAASEAGAAAAAGAGVAAAAGAAGGAVSDMVSRDCEVCVFGLRGG